MACTRVSMRWQLGLMAIAAIVFFTNLGVPRLWDRDEPRNAGCAAEMLQRGDWVVPVFNAQLRTHKPVLLYWLMMIAYAVFGVGEFAARFWSASLAVGTVLTTFHIGRRVLDDEAGFWGALVLATTIMFAVAARAATPDSVLIFFMTLALAVYVRGTFPAPGAGDDPVEDVVGGPAGRWFPNRWSVVALMYAMMGLAVLAKGPVGLVLPTAALGMFLLVMDVSPAGERDNDPGRPAWRRRLEATGRVLAPRHIIRTCWRMRPFTAAIVVLAVAAPWYLWVGLRTDGVWLRQFFLVHNVGRAAQPMEGHGGALFYYVIALCVGFFPWSVFFGPTWSETATRIRDNHRWKPGLILLICWAGTYIGLFSLAQTKLPSYITPAYPAIALLTGGFLCHDRRQAARAPVGLTHWALLIFGMVGIALLVGLPVVAHHYLPGTEWLGLIGLVPLLGGAVAYRWHARGKPAPAVGACAVAAALFVTGLVGLVPVVADRHRPFLGRLQAMAGRAGTPVVASWGCLEPSWVFYTGRPIRQFGLADAAAAFLAGSERNLLITTASRYRRIRGQLPEDAGIVARGPAFLRQETLVLVRRGVPRAVAAGRRNIRSANRR